MGPTLKKYHEEARKALKKVLAAAKAAIGSAELDDALQYLKDLSLSIEDERKLNGLKTSINANERAGAMDRIMDSRDYIRVRNQNVNDLLLFIDELYSKTKLELAIKSRATYTHFKLDEFIPTQQMLVRASWVAKARNCAAAIGRINSPQGSNTGLLLQNNYLLTAKRCLPDQNCTTQATFQIDYKDRDKGQVIEYGMQSETLLLHPELDLALVKAADQLLQPLAKWSALEIRNQRLQYEMPLYLIGAVSDSDLALGVYRLHLSNFDDQYLYFENTNIGGLEGGFLFDENWNVIGMMLDEERGIGFNEQLSFIKGQEIPEEEFSVTPPTEETPTTEVIPESPKLRFSKHHQYTCNRFAHSDVFDDYQGNFVGKQRLHFFYLHGGKYQSHWGLVQRFVSKLEGRENDHKIEQKKSHSRVFDFDITFPRRQQKDRLLVELPKEVLEAFGLTQEQIQAVKDKNLAFALSCPGSTLHEANEKDRVCLLIQISERTWDKDLIPEITRWFIEDFCQNGLPDNAPEFFVFFAILYKEENHDRIESEVTQALADGVYTQSIFDPLEMVTRDDIEDWFDEYIKYWDNSQRKKDSVLERYFDEQPDEMYMDDVQDILGKVIKEINQKHQ